MHLNFKIGKYRTGVFEVYVSCWNKFMLPDMNLSFWSQSHCERWHTFPTKLYNLPLKQVTVNVFV